VSQLLTTSSPKGVLSSIYDTDASTCLNVVAFPDFYVRGAAETAMAQEISEQTRAAIFGRIPIGRFVDVDEVARMVAFLCLDGWSFSTGAIIDLPVAARLTDMCGQEALNVR
jgi:NAD(P)-dependent dehydrogenase (short-subunit alcohol dehydrogenase family)